MAVAQPDNARDFFDTARMVAATILFVAGVVAVAGTFLDWVTITPPERVPASQEDALATFTGIETSDGRLIAIGGVVLAGMAALLVLKKRSRYAWIAFVVSVILGAIAIADYRDITGVFYDEMQRIGRPHPAIGLFLDAAAAVAGLVGSLAGIAATPNRDS
jgi:hypothetical protein